MTDTPRRSPLRRVLRGLSWLLAVLVGVPVLAVAALFAGLNLAPGQRAATSLLNSTLAGTVALHGLHGRFPDQLRLDRIEVLDRDGTYLTLEDVALDWHPLALLRRTADIDRLAAARLVMARLPVSEPAKPGTPPSSSGAFELPVRVVLDRLDVARAEIARPVAGAAAVLALTGHASLDSLQQGAATLDIHRLDSAGTYTLDGSITPATLHAVLDVAEPEGGLVGGLAALPALGALTAHAKVDGPWATAATQVAIDAGPLVARGDGTLDLEKYAADMRVSLHAPAMQPRPDISWQSVALDTVVQGPFTAPHATGTLRATQLAVASAKLRLLTADLSGDQGRVGLRATAEGLDLPGAPPGLAASPLVLTADGRLDTADRPVTFTLAHPLVRMDGTGKLGTPLQLAVTVDAPQIAPFAALAGQQATGHVNVAARLAQDAAGATAVEVDGTLAMLTGPAPAPALLGPDAHFAVRTTLAGSDVTITRASVDGAQVHLVTSGAVRNNVLDVAWTLGLPKLAVLAPTLAGDITAAGTVRGPFDAFGLDATVDGRVAVPGVPTGPLHLVLASKGLPTSPEGTLQASGELAGSPLSLDLQVARAADGALDARIARADWRSVHAGGAVHLAPGATLPTGDLTARIARLDDLRPFIGQPVAGALTLDAKLDAQAARVKLLAEGAGMAGNRVSRATVDADIADPLGTPRVSAHAVVDGIAAGGITGNARIDVAGPQDALAIKATSALAGLAGADARIAAQAVLDVPGKQVRVSQTQVDWKGESLRLLAPLRVAFGDGVVLDRLRLGLRQAVLEAQGRVSPQLDLTASLRNVTAELARIAVPDLKAQGSLSADARLQGAPARPEGTIRVDARGLRLLDGPAAGLPPATVAATAQLAGGNARVDGRIDAGSKVRLALTGQVPLDPAGALAVRANGALDLTVLDPILAANGRRVRGRATLDLAAAGTVAAPRLNGTVRLADGEVQDFTQGVRLDAVTALVEAQGDTLRLSSFSAKAGPGTITASGSVGALQPGLPVDIRIRLADAKPLASDRLQAWLDGDIRVHGQVQPPAAGPGLAIAGTVGIRRAEIGVPETLGASVVTLDVRRPGQVRPPPPAPAAPIALDLAISAPARIFVRGRGLDAELAGTLRLRGTSASPQIDGGFEMRRGAISLAGTTLTFTTGKVTFEGAGLQNRIDPTLNFVAESSTAAVTARLSITGLASNPKITFSSTPELPQDEVLAYLLFKRSSKELGPFQIAEIAAAIAQLTGVTGSGNPLDMVRKGLGLDRLSVGGGTSGSSPTLEAGRYVGNGVYVGAKQGTTGSETQAVVQIDIAKGLKVETDVGSGTGGNAVGLTYGFEW